MIGDWIDDSLGWLAGALIAAAVFLVGYGIYDSMTAETFALRKDEWACTKAHRQPVTTTTMAGKVPIVQTQIRTVCDQWSRK